MAKGERDVQENVVVTILGARGTIPVEGARVSRYGGATACVLVRMGGETIVLDAGTGILELERVLRPEERTIRLLLSHPHFDHMLGLASCTALYDPAYRFEVCAAERGGLGPREQLERLMSPPLWPVGPEAFAAEMDYRAVGTEFRLGGVSVRAMEGVHPGGCSVYRLEHGGTSVVYASDYELDGDSAAPLADFARGCTLLLCDGQYSDAEFEERRGFGHSTWRAAARLAVECGAGMLRILHHAPCRSDDQMDSDAPALARIFDNGAFAWSGEEIGL